MSVYLFLEENLWVIYLALVFVPFILLLLVKYFRIINDLDRSGFPGHFVLFSIFNYLVFFMTIIGMFFLPEGVGSSILINLLFYGGLIIIPMNHMLFILSFMTTRNMRG